MIRLTRRSLLTRVLPAAAALPLAVLAARPARAATHQVSIQGFAFVPAQLNVSAGDTVVFTNNDSAPHTATAADGSFDTGTIRRGRSAQVTVRAGAHDYRCSFHPAMKGTITAA